MGCRFPSSTTTTRNQTSSTAKVITPSGDLWEFSSPIKSSLLVDESSPFVICDSDCLLYDQRVPALGPDDPVLPAHLYFILPVKKLEFSLTRDEMADLAVKATAALSAPNKKRGRNQRKKKNLRPEDDVVVRVDDVTVTSLPTVVQKTKVVRRSPSTRGRVAPVPIRSSLGMIKEEA